MKQKHSKAILKSRKNSSNNNKNKGKEWNLEQVPPLRPRAWTSSSKSRVCPLQVLCGDHTLTGEKALTNSSQRHPEARTCDVVKHLNLPNGGTRWPWWLVASGSVIKWAVRREGGTGRNKTEPREDIRRVATPPRRSVLDGRGIPCLLQDEPGR